MFRLWFGSVVVVVVGGCAQAHSEPTEAPPPAAAADGVRKANVNEAQRRMLTIEAAHSNGEAVALTAPGHVAFKDGATAEVGAPVDGRVTAVRVSVGDKVAKGAPLVLLNSPAAAEARANIAKAVADYNLAKEAARREHDLLDKGVGRQVDALEADAKLAEADAELARAKAAQTLVGDGDGIDVIVRAPIAGKVLAKKATVGASVQAGGSDPLVVIGDNNSLWVEVDVFERDLPLVKEGAEAQVEIATLSQPVSAKVMRIGASVDDDMRRAHVFLSFAGDVPGLSPGMSARASFKGSGTVLTIPSTAVILRQGKDATVYVQNDKGELVPRAVSIGRTQSGTVQILSGLQDGEKIVTKGALLLDGTAEQLL
jgi:cobalt-zinc-cadmium efflux system membrane fusion protein